MAIVGTTGVAVSATAVQLCGGSFRESTESDGTIERTLFVANTSAVPIRVGGSNVTSAANGVLIAATTGTLFVYLHHQSDQVWAAAASAATCDTLLSGE